jgi:hypothetical protein
MVRFAERDAAARRAGAGPGPIRESSARASSAARVRRRAAPYDLLPTGWLDQDTDHRRRDRGVRDRAPYLDTATLAPRRRTDGELRDARLGRLDEWLADRVEEVRATAGELDSAERRAGLVIDALAEIYPGAETYRTGSIAHGDAMHPLNDVDLGVILRDRTDIGPGRAGVRREMRRVARLLEAHLSARFPAIAADAEGKRSIVLTFTEPGAASGPDFTCDVIIALAEPDGSLLIPNTEAESGWDANDPRGHAERVRRADAESGGSLSRTVRLAKHWRDRHGKPLYSWNIKTLALEALSGRTHAFEGLYRFFEHAVPAVAGGPTENPGSMNYPPPTVAGDRGETTLQLLAALDRLEEIRLAALAAQHDRAEAGLARFFGDAPPSRV